MSMTTVAQTAKDLGINFGVAFAALSTLFNGWAWFFRDSDWAAIRVLIAVVYVWRETSRGERER